MMEGLFRLLFKYRPLEFAQADFTFAASKTMLAGMAVVCVAAVYALLTYRGALTGDARGRAMLTGLRLALLAVLAFCLCRPTLVLKAAVPQQNFLGVLVDDSRSMQIADGGEPRGDFVRQQLGRPDAPLLNALSKRFVLRFFRFSSSADRIASPSNLRYDGTATHLGHALERARDELAGLPLAGVVVVSDGADTSARTLDEPLASLKARSIPVYTVAVGRSRFDKDIQLTRVETPRSTLKGTSLVVNAVVTATGYAGQTVPLTVEDEGHITGSTEVTLPADGESATVRVRFTAAEAGARIVKFSIPPQPGEQVTANNAREALIEVRDAREKILYFEGEPRFEAKFVLQAVDADKNLQVVLLDRTAENKYFRRNVDTPDELAGGFPKTRDELFAYRGIILGSVEAASFTPDQQRMLADFVSRRGGGLLMLGGRRAFAEGGWAGTPLADVSPVSIPAGARKDHFAELQVRVTKAGALVPLTELGATTQASTARWNDLPSLSSVNPIADVKPGATVLLSGLDNGKREQVVLAFQRYGRGKAAAFAVQDSWRWQMDPKTPISDPTYSTFWRRLIRWLVDSVPDHVTATTSEDQVDPGQPVTITAAVADESYVDVNDGQVTAHVTAPSGKTSDIALEWNTAREGEYRGTFVADEQGVFAVKVDASRGRAAIGSDRLHIRAAPGDSEYFDAAMRAPLLRRIAEDTGGRFYTPATAGSLADDIGFSGRGVTVVEEHEIWDMPVILLLVVALAGGEWALRRTRGLA